VSPLAGGPTLEEVIGQEADVRRDGLGADGLGGGAGARGQRLRVGGERGSWPRGFAGNEEQEERSLSEGHGGAA
jgi:hypothetical protein